MAKTIFFVEMTDTFGEDANYAWVKRFLVSATTALGAMRKVAKHTGLYVKLRYSGEVTRYNAVGACICFFVQESDGTENAHCLTVESI